MKLDERKSFDILSSLRVMGDPEYGGTGSISENILVGELKTFINVEFLN